MQQDSQKRKNLATTNYSDFDDASKERIWQQVLQSVSTASDAASVSSSITDTTDGTTTASAGAGRGRGKPVIYMYDAQVLQTESNRPPCRHPKWNAAHHAPARYCPRLQQEPMQSMCAGYRSSSLRCYC